MSKKKGYRNEDKARRILKDAGYTVMRSGGSFGLFDLIAINTQGIRLIQIKSNDPPGPVEREAIELFDNLPSNAVKEVWVFHDYIRKPSIKTWRGSVWCG